MKRSSPMELGFKSSFIIQSKGRDHSTPSSKLVNRVQGRTKRILIKLPDQCPKWYLKNVQDAKTKRKRIIVQAHHHPQPSDIAPERLVDAAAARQRPREPVREPGRELNA